MTCQKTLDIEECIRMKVNDTEWFTNRKRAWDEHKIICEKRGLQPLAWEFFKRVVMQKSTFEEMIEAGVEFTASQKITATIIPFRINQ